MACNLTYLIDEPPLNVLPSLAKAIGLNEAIVLQQIKFWLCVNESKRENFRENRYWTYNTHQQWLEEFSWMKLTTLKSTLKNLKSQGLIITKAFEAKSHNQTLWYTIDYEALGAVIIASKARDAIRLLDQSDSDYSTSRDAADRVSESRPMITETSTEISTETSTEESDLAAAAAAAASIADVPTVSSIDDRSRQVVKPPVESKPQAKKPSVKPKASGEDTSAAAPKNSTKRKKPKPPERSQHDPDHCQKLWEKWRPFFTKVRETRDSLPGFVEGYDYLRGEGHSAEDIESGLNYYVDNKLKQFEQCNDTVMPPDGIRFFKGKSGHPSSYCLDALALKRERETEPESQEPFMSKGDARLADTYKLVAAATAALAS
jgi:hypothetical protein